MPIPGALVSIFGQGVHGSGLITFADNGGQFSLPALPAGSYTLRAVAGKEKAAVREVTVLPNHNSIFTLSLAPNIEAENEEAEADRSTPPKHRELRWLLRHKRRSVLEARDHEVEVVTAHEAPRMAKASESPEATLVGGSLELMTSPDLLGSASSEEGTRLASGLGSVRLNGRLADIGEWTLGGLLAESETSSWRMAAEFVVEPGGGHELRAGAGFGTRYVVPLLYSDAKRDDQQVGAMFIQDTWEIDERLRATVGARYSHIAFLEDANHLDPVASIELRPDDQHRFRAGVSTRTLIPGGDLLTLSTLGSSPTMLYALMGPDVRAEKLVRWNLDFERVLGSTQLATHAFWEDVSDRLVNAYWGGTNRSLHVLNGPGYATRGVGVSLGHQFGSALSGSLTYTYGQSRADAAEPRGVVFHLPEGDFHDLVARLETAIDWSDTRVTVYYRVNALSPEQQGEPARKAHRKQRFDVQLSQGVPFLTSLTRAEWDLLLALRNVFYEVDEGGSLDEMAVLNPPTRVMGGISVQF